MASERGILQRELGICVEWPAGPGTLERPLWLDDPLPFAGRLLPGMESVADLVVTPGRFEMVLASWKAWAGSRAPEK